jgi:hypothetical protein
MALNTSVEAQLLLGVEYTYGGEGPDRSGYVASAGLPLYRGAMEYDLLVWYGKRFTREDDPVRDDPRTQFNNADHEFFGLSPVIRFPNIGLGIAPRIGYSSQFFSYIGGSVECSSCIVENSDTRLFYGVDLQYAISSALLLTTGFSPLNGFGLGALVRIPLPSLKKDVSPK